MKYRLLPILTCALLLAVAAPRFASAAPVSRDDLKVYLETREALQDERVLKMPEAKRIPEIAKRNFKMKPETLQAIMDKVEAEGGESAIADKARKSIEEALASTDLKGRIQEVRIDASSPHVVSYIKWTCTPDKVDQEAALVALKAGGATEIPSTFYLWAVDAKGADLWRAKIGADRTRNIREDRIADWAATRYVKLFEVERLAN
ncbi:hypothetical protein [Vulgatibacter incomptus]|uniref:Lipoprotein n=1 Tax=Vulgatibacter incomptus TaxID=1391653 RepID=A0A0K1PCD3_9BACT|nr:hypothetical protein [Vulgatibacter incomptus]AKU91076.1 hypothetical protein AKJ08_1463 [Vulgatibacter incomptus]